MMCSVPCTPNTSSMTTVCCNSLVLSLVAATLLGCVSAAPYQSPPPGYKHTAFRLIVPQFAIEQGSLHWHDALRHAAFLSLRRGIGSSDGNTEMTLWRRVSTAQVSPFELAKPVDEDADITTLATGVLLNEAGRFSFVPEAAVLERGRFKVSALWSVLRVRHSGPGLQAPRIEYYFTVQPASHLTLLDYVERQRTKVVFKKPFPKPKPTYVYKEVPIPVYSNVPGQYYTPQFVSRYRNTIQKFVLTPETEQTDKENTEPFYLIQAPARYAAAQLNDFPRLSPQNDVPQLVNIVIPRRPVHDPATQESVNHPEENLPDAEKIVEPRAATLSSEDKEKKMVPVSTIERSTTTSSTTTTTSTTTERAIVDTTTTESPTTTTILPEETSTNATS
ncbi:hypothetical protein B566_EDAN015844 [Ephemera danica]|nr:hypothetical protein B566_EDAN015844 [Ephemera danica]